MQPYVPSSIGARPPALSLAIRWRLLDQVFKPNRIVLNGSLYILVTGLMMWLRVGSASVPLWCAVSIGLLLARARMARAYHRATRGGDPSSWETNFTLVSWATGAVWGLTSVVIVATADPVLHFLVVAAQCTYVYAAVAQNSSQQRAALGQVLLVKVPVALACIATRDLSYGLYAICAFVEIMLARARISELLSQNIDLLDLNEQLGISRASLEAANARLESLATTDGLTGITNRRGFDTALEREWQRTRREHLPMSLLMIDLDHFKKLNDTLGHAAGDGCLRDVARQLQAMAVRPTDVVARYGGEEFAIVLSGTDAHGARTVAERVRAGIAEMRIPHPANATGTVTASVGFAGALPDDTMGADMLIALADGALYRAKESGRDRVCGAAPPRVIRSQSSDIALAERPTS